MKNLALILGFVFLLWQLFSAFRNAKKAEDEETAARPHSQDVPAWGWVIITAATLGLPAFILLYTGHKSSDEMPIWLIVAFSAFMGFLLSAVLVFAAAGIGRAIKSSLSPDLPESAPPKPVSIWRRAFGFLLTGLFLAYGLYGLWIDDLYIPGSARGGEARPGMHLHGISADLVFAGWFVITLGTLMDPSNGAKRGIAFRKYWRIWVLAGVGIMFVGIFWK